MYQNILGQVHLVGIGWLYLLVVNDLFKTPKSILGLILGNEITEFIVANDFTHVCSSMDPTLTQKLIAPRSSKV